MEKNALLDQLTTKMLYLLYYVKIDELFDILHETHSAIGHGGRNRMMAELKNKYCNITNETVMIYLKLCVQC